MDTCELNFTNLESKIFSYLCMRSGERFSKRDIARALEVSPTAVGKSLKKLIDHGIVVQEDMKNINFIAYNRTDRKALGLKRSENLKVLYISGLIEYLEEALAGSTIILFGSYSRGEDISSSDIDIAVIGRKEKMMDIERYERYLNKKLNINFYPSWKDIHKHLKNNILNGIVLSGSVDV